MRETEEYLNAQRCPLAYSVIPIGPDRFLFNHYACTVPGCLGNAAASQASFSLCGHTGTSVLGPEQLKEDFGGWEARKVQARPFLLSSSQALFKLNQAFLLRTPLLPTNLDKWDIKVKHPQVAYLVLGPNVSNKHSHKKLHLLIKILTYFLKVLVSWVDFQNPKHSIEWVVKRLPLV